MSVTPEGRREPPSTSFSQEDRPSGIDRAAVRTASITEQPLGHLARVDDELVALAFELEGER
jgi:hypothetical protein